jgi:hypothetical protein
MSRKSKDKGAQKGNAEIEKKYINMCKNKQRNKFDKNKNKQNEKKK